ncbi:MAG: DUF1552 domain-containing protein [Archangium sp.]|nr:DUF1552 domain-containing protein [Archangium sp.]
MTTRLSRRFMLRGLGGVSLGLPLLEIMLDRKAFAQNAPTPPKRYLVFFDGQSTGADNDQRHNDLVPNTVGRNYDLKSALAPLGELKSEVSVVSGLKIPWAAENGGTIPAGGRRDGFHVSTVSPLLAGVRSSASTTAAMGPTSDQVVAGFLAGNTPFPSLAYRVQADWYLSVSAPYGREFISYKRDTSNRITPIPAQVSPRQAFNALFGNFTPPGVDAATRARIDFEKRSRKSILDIVRGDTERLVPKLGAADQIRLQRHLDGFRDLERRVDAIAPPETSSCIKPMDPGADPPTGSPQGQNGAGENTYAQNLGYSNEEQRANLFVDLIHMAMVCDLTRVATLQMTMFQSHLNMFSITGQATDCHELGHGGVPGGTMAMSQGIAWHVKHFARLVQKFRDTREGNGTLLDNSALLFLLEGGHGYDPEGVKNNSSHSTENMACLIAGRAGGLSPGQHVVAAGRHPANVVISAMKAVGAPDETLGEVNGAIPQLFSTT